MKRREFTEEEKKEARRQKQTKYRLSFLSVSLARESETGTPKNSSTFTSTTTSLVWFGFFSLPSPSLSKTLTKTLGSHQALQHPRSFPNSKIVSGNGIDPLIQLPVPPSAPATTLPPFSFPRPSPLLYHPLFHPPTHHSLLPLKFFCCLFYSMSRFVVQKLETRKERKSHRNFQVDGAKRQRREEKGMNEKTQKN